MIDIYVPKNVTKKKGGTRSDRVSKVIRQFLSELFLRNDLPPALDKKRGVVSLKSIIIINEVKVSPDLRNANILFVPPTGNNKESDLWYLKNMSPYIRSQLAKAINMRHVPKLIFKADETIEKVKHIEELLKKISS